MRSRHRMQEHPAPGLDVFLTFSDRKGKEKTIPALLNPLGQVVYGSSLDPDAEGVYELAPGCQADCQSVQGEVVAGDFVYLKIWRNGLTGCNEILKEYQMGGPFSLHADTSLHLNVNLPLGKEYGYV